ncbi:VOC family protein [Mucilaginibacter panaciglaebae]|uniref:VOC family protein n=1 Tax=Mucilaginibacter panaciglaebae TaxID=502331 RepID=A0ABP7X6R5_9SPHI
MSKITPFLWFDDNLDEAIKFYQSVFKNSRLLFEVQYGDAGPGPKGTTMTATFELEGQKFMALNGGPMFKFTEAISMFITCNNQDEIDYYWERLAEGGQKSRCGWLKDKFGLSWQVVPYNLLQLLHNNDPQKASNVMQAMMKMDKMDMSALEEAGK